MHDERVPDRCSAEDVKKAYIHKLDKELKNTNSTNLITILQVRFKSIRVVLFILQCLGMIRTKELH